MTALTPTRETSPPSETPTGLLPGHAALSSAAEPPVIVALPHINFTPDNQPKPIAPTQTPADRVKAAIAAMNASLGADLHDRLHAQHNALNAMFDALFPPA
jgi:hypothetical protein